MPSLAAERMRRHRQRRRRWAALLYMIELRATEIETLIHKGLLRVGNA